jgi:hypothetical protein
MILNNSKYIFSNSLTRIQLAIKPKWKGHQKKRGKIYLRLSFGLFSIRSTTNWNFVDVWSCLALRFDDHCRRYRRICPRLCRSNRANRLKVHLLSTNIIQSSLKEKIINSRKINKLPLRTFFAFELFCGFLLTS